MLYCIDSHTFIWAVKKQADPHDQHRLDEARALMDWVDASKHQLIVPSIVLAECLIKEPLEVHPAILAAAHKRFIIPQFDARCAAKYGELLRLDNWESAKASARENSIRREKMKLDHMILCCALVHGANGLFTEDPQFIKFAEPHIKILSTKSIGTQTALQLD